MVAPLLFARSTLSEMPLFTMSKNVALICTSASELKGKPTGAWLEEIATPYYTLLDAGYEVSFVSTKGGQIPIDAASTQGDFYTPDCVKFMADETAVAALSSSAALASYDFSSVAGGLDNTTTTWHQLLP